MVLRLGRSRAQAGVQGNKAGRESRVSKELVQRLRNVSNMINMGEKIRWGEETALMDEAADLIERQSAEIERLRKLDAEYGTVEAAIIMADPLFDGDSDHPSCGARLIDSINRMGSTYRRSLTPEEGE